MLLECLTVSKASSVVEMSHCTSSQHIVEMFHYVGSQWCWNIRLCREYIIFAKCTITAGANNEPYWYGCL